MNFWKIRAPTNIESILLWTWLSTYFCHSSGLQVLKWYPIGCFPSFGQNVWFNVRYFHCSINCIFFFHFKETKYLWGRLYSYLLITNVVMWLQWNSGGDSHNIFYEKSKDDKTAVWVCEALSSSGKMPWTLNGNVWSVLVLPQGRLYNRLGHMTKGRVKTA